MNKFFNKFLLILTLMFFLSMLMFAIWAMWQRTRDPISALDRGIFDLEIVTDTTYQVDLITEKRFYTEFILYHENVDTVYITTSIPMELPAEGLPVIIVLGGLERGREGLKYIPHHGRNIIITYSYPYSPRYWYDGTAIKEVPIIRQAVMKVPAQVESIARWAVLQRWSDKRRVSVIGYSFGAFFVPAIYHLANSHHFELGPSVIAYAGVDIYKLLRHNLKNISAFPRTIVAWIAATAIYPSEPALHLPRMKGDFLLINGKNDHQIPEESWKHLHKLTPKPKTIMIIDAGHMHPSKPELTLRLVNISRNWLLKKNAINP